MMDKGSVDQKAYVAALEASGKASNWDERENFVMVAATDEALAEKMQLKTTTAEDVPEIGKIVGIENGSCTARLPQVHPAGRGLLEGHVER